MQDNNIVSSLIDLQPLLNKLLRCFFKGFIMKLQNLNLKNIFSLENSRFKEAKIDNKMCIDW